MSPKAALWRAELVRLIQAALDCLPGHYGDVLEWKYVDGLSVKEIAERLAIGPKAAESYLTRARGAFREAIAAISGRRSARSRGRGLDMTTGRDVLGELVRAAGRRTAPGARTTSTSSEPRWQHGGGNFARGVAALGTRWPRHWWRRHRRRNLPSLAAGTPTYRDRGVVDGMRRTARRGEHVASAATRAEVQPAHGLRTGAITGLALVLEGGAPSSR